MAHGYPDFEGPKSGLYIITEWSAKEGTDKTLGGGANISAPNVGVAMFNYLVPVGNTLYVTQFSGQVQDDVAMGIQLRVIHDVSEVGQIWSGGQVGTSVVLPKPVVVKELEVVSILIMHFGEGTKLGYGSLTGYEVESE